MWATKLKSPMIVVTQVIAAKSSGLAWDSGSPVFVGVTLRHTRARWRTLRGIQVLVAVRESIYERIEW